jgi:hypothetical protein
MDRKVTSVKKDKSGNIVALCNPGQSWSPRRTKDVLKDIRAGRKSYYVEEVPRRAYVRVISGGTLQSTPTAGKNSLTSLPTA